MFKYTTKEKIEYTVYQADEITSQIISEEIKNSDFFDTHYTYALELAKKKVKNSKSKSKRQTAINNTVRKSYLSDICMGFDIETTTVDKKAYMYHWQLSLNSLIITGRTWEDFYSVLEISNDSIGYELNTAFKKRHKRLTKGQIPEVTIWVANLPFEFQFMKDRFQWGNLFAKSHRKVLSASISNTFFTFRDCLQISGGSLEFLAKNYTTTQKRKGDLDYTIPRNSLTPLTETELNYCLDDVAILSEWHKYFYNTYKTQNYTPITSTGILRHEVKKRQDINDVFKVWNDFPGEKEYKKVMKYAFKGGYAHGNINYIGKELNNQVMSRDITSSYPYVMLTKKFPQGKFYKHEKLEESLNKVDKENIHGYIETCLESFNFYSDVILLNPVAKNNHTYISLSKCINFTEINKGTNQLAEDKFYKSIIDNGRILRAEKTHTVETDLDILTILEFYDFDEIIFKDVMVCGEIGLLPSYLTDPIKTAYINKARLKSNGKDGTVEYMVEKGKVNSGYGMTVAKLIEREIIYNSDTHEWGYTEDNEWDKTRFQAFLNCMVGVWVTAYARRRLMTMINDNTIVCDTDSVYFLKSDKIEKIFDEENKKVLAENKKFFNNPELYELGIWDKQTLEPYKRFATLGAKRYMLEETNGKWKQVVAGLPKTVIYSYAKSNKLDPMEIFLNIEGVHFDTDASKKNITSYSDTEHTDNIKDINNITVTMHECSSVSINKTSFNMNLAELFRIAIAYIEKNINTKTERR